jgi:hypothetical protein
MTEAEFERQQRQTAGDNGPADHEETERETTPAADRDKDRERERDREPATRSGRSRGTSRARASTAKPKRVQRMFAIEEELDKKLWLYAIHMGKDRSEVVNDLLRPLVSSMVLYDSRDRRNARGNNDSSDDDNGSSAE